MWNAIPQPQIPPQQPYQPGGIAPPVPGIQNRPRLEPIDWNLVAVLNADIIRRTKDYDSLQKLVQIFMGAKLYPGSSRILVHPLCLRLCQLLQVAFEYLSFCQAELSASNTKLELENSKLVEKSTKLESKIKKKDQIIQAKSIPYDKCPICEKKFKNLDFVDRHIRNRHPEILNSWDIIRGRKPPEINEKNDNVQIILDKIDNLKNSLKRRTGKHSNNSIEQELLATQDELMTAEELREQQIMKQNEEIRRELFEAADNLNSSMTLYKENTQKKKVKKTNQQMAIVNLFDQNAEVNPNDFQNAEPSPFNKDQEDEVAKQKRVNDFFNQAPNPFQKHQFRPSNEVEDGPNWETQIKNRNNIVNPFQNKSHQYQFSVQHENINNVHNQNQINNQNIVRKEDEFIFNDIQNNIEFENIEPIMNTGFKNNFSIENMNHNDIQVITQSKTNSDENNNGLFKPIPKQAILAAKQFISRQNNDKNNANNKSRTVNTTPENIEKVITMIGEKVHAEVQRLGPNGSASVMLRQKYGDNDPNYLQLRKQIQQKLEMEYPIDGNVTKVKKGFDLVHTEDLASINNNNNNNYTRYINNIRNIENVDEINDSIYSSPSKEQLITNKTNLNSYGDSQFTSAFEFQNNKNKQPERTKNNEEKESKKESPEKKTKKSKIEISEVVSAVNNSELHKSENAVNDNKNNDDIEWSYVSSSSPENKVEPEQEKAEKNIKNPIEISRHSISFDSSSHSSKLKSKVKQNKDDNKTDFDLIQTDMKPNFSDSPSRKTETQALTPVQNQNRSKSKLSTSIIKSGSSGRKNDSLVQNEENYKTPERKKPIKSDAISLEIFNSPVLSGSSSAKSKGKSNSNRKILLDDDEEFVENLSDIDRMFQKSKDLSENSESEKKQNLNESSDKIKPLSDGDEFNFPPVSTDSFLNSSNDEINTKNKQKAKEKLDKKNQLSNRRENNSKINQSSLNSNLADKDSESNASKQSRMSVLSSAIRIGRAEDTKAIFQDSSINDTDSPSAAEKELVVSRRKPKNSPIKNQNKEILSNENKNIKISLDDSDPIETEKEKKKRYEEYNRIADEKFKKEFDFDIDIDQNDEKQINTKKDDSLDEFELTGKSNEQISILEEEEMDDSEDESGFTNPPPRFEFHLKAVDEENEIPVKSTINDSKNNNNKSGIKIINNADTKYGKPSRLITGSNNSSNININNKSNTSLSTDGKKTILKQAGIIMINKTNTRYGQPRTDYDSAASRINDDNSNIDRASINKNSIKQFNEENDKNNQLLSSNILRNSRNFNTNKNSNSNNDEYSDEDNKYGYVSDDDEINNLPRPNYFKAMNDDVIRPKKNSKRNRKPPEENSLFSSPLPPDPSVSSDSPYQPENERLTFYEKDF